MRNQHNLEIPWVIMRPYEYLISFSLVSSGSPTQVKCPINTSTVIQRYLNFTVNGFSILVMNYLKAQHLYCWVLLSKLNKMLEWSCDAVSILLYTQVKHSSSLGWCCVGFNNQGYIVISYFCYNHQRNPKELTVCHKAVKEH